MERRGFISIKGQDEGGILGVEYLVFGICIGGNGDKSRK